MAELSLSGILLVRERIERRAYIVARSVVTENPATSDHAVRETLALRMIGGKGDWVQIARLVLTHPAIDAAVTTEAQFLNPAVVSDAEIDQALTTIWTYYAKAL